MKKISLLIIFFILISCDGKIKEYYFSNKNLKKEYYLNENKYDGLYKEYYKSGNLKEKHFYTKGIKIDTSYFYYDNDLNIIKGKIYHSLNKEKDSGFVYNENNKLISKGLLNKSGIKIGKWYFFYNTGGLKEVIEYFNINQKEFVNQRWRYNKKGKLDPSKSNFFEIKTSSDTISKNEEIKLLFNLTQPFFSKKSRFYAIIPIDQSKLKIDFSNFNNIEKDTVLSLNEEGRSRDYDKHNHSLIFSMSYKESGMKHIRGVLIERIENDSFDVNDSIKYKKRYLYFNKNLYVK